MGETRTEFLQRAEEEMRAAGFEPLDPYPGSTVKRWRARCVNCGIESSPRLTKVRTGRACITCEAARKDAERAAHEHTFRSGPGGTDTVLVWIDTIPLMSDEWQGVPKERAEEEMRAAGFEPLEPFPQSVDLPWRCRCTVCGRESTKRLVNVRSGAAGCRFCAPNAKVEPASADADIRAAGFEPLEPYPGHSRKPWRCLCTSCGTVTTPRIEFVRRGAGCPVCAAARRGVKRRLPSEEALTSIRAAGFEPLEPYPGSKKPWRSRCATCGNESTPALNAIRNQGTRCRFCAGRPVAPEEEMRAAGFEPLAPYPGNAHHQWPCRCLKCGGESVPALHSVRRGTGCRFCARRTATDEAVAVMRAAGFEPLVPYPGSKKPWQSRCTVCGEESSPHFSSVSKGSRCRFCARRKQVVG